jgi:hypothetical protein
VNPGWRDSPAGENGESVIVSWQHVLSGLARAAADGFAPHLDALRRTVVMFRANNVIEDFATQPIVYPLPDAEGEYDLGVRLKQDLDEKLPALAAQVEDFPRFEASLSRLMAAANDPAYQSCFPMESGDLIIVDNNRYGHGRRTVRGWKDTGGRVEANPRELWSVTIG